MKNFCKTFLIILLSMSSSALSESLPIPFSVPDFVKQQNIPGIHPLTITEGGESLETRINGKKVVLVLGEEVTIEEGAIYKIEGIVGYDMIYVTGIKIEENPAVIPMLKPRNIKLHHGQKVSLRGEFIITI